MAQEILVMEQIQPGLEFLRQFDQQYPVKVGFWVKDEHSHLPELFVASDEFRDDNHRGVYADVIAVARRVSGYGLDPGDVRVINGNDRRVADALSLQLPAGSLVRPLRTQRIGSHYFEEVYVYPPLHPVSADDGRPVPVGQP